MKTFTKLFFSTVLLCSFNAQAQYCTLPGRTPYSTNQPGITNFKLNTINRTSAGVESMSSVVVVTNDSTTLMRGQTYTVSISHSRDAVTFPDARNNIRVWIDYNNDKDFDDAGETAISSDYDTTSKVFTASFTVPSTATLGTTRLRATAKMSSDAGHTIPTSCDLPTPDPLGYHGEIEDYKVIIAPATGINDIKTGDLSINIYPNPATDLVNVSFNKISHQPMSIDLFDITGKVIKHLMYISDQDSQSYEFNLDQVNIPNGMFLIKASSTASSAYQKIIKMD